MLTNLLILININEIQSSHDISEKFKQCSGFDHYIVYIEK